MDSLHVFLEEEIDKYKKQIYQLEKENKSFKDERLAYENKIEELEAEIEYLKRIINEETYSINNLRRICIERANADRGLKPKKKHSGFVVVSTASYFERYQSSIDRQMKEFLAYRTVIQIPYLTENTAFGDVFYLLKEDNYSFKDCLGGNIKLAKYACNENAESQKLENREFNYIFRWFLKGSLQKKYWEIEAYHTKPYIKIMGR